MAVCHIDGRGGGERGKRRDAGGKMKILDWEWKGLYAML